MKPIVLRFGRTVEKSQTWRYRETEPGMVIGGFYISKLAIHYAFEGNPPRALKVTIEPADDDV